MAADLYPTRTRLRLLGDVAAGRVRQAESGYTFASGPGSDKRRVDAQIRELRDAGWVEQVDGTWHLTAAGRDVLDGAQ